MSDSSSVSSVVGFATSLALAAFTAVLAWATVVYARRTSDMVSEMRLQARPVLLLTPDMLGGVMPLVRLSNVGGGAALNLSGQLSIVVKGTTAWTFQFKLDLMPSGAYHQLIPLRADEHLSVHQMAQDDYEYLADLAYADTRGGQYHLRHAVHWRDITEHVFGANVLIPPEPNSSIVEQLREIRRAVERLKP